MSIPKEFVDLATAYNSPANSFVNIIGIVVDIMPATLTAKGDHMLTFKVLDRRLHDSVYGSEGLRVRFFKSDERRLPQVQQHGDIVLLRKLKMAVFQQQRIALSNHQTETTVFPAAAIPEPNFEIAFLGNRRVQSLGIPLDTEKLSLEEQRYVIALKHEMSPTVQAIAAHATSHAPPSGAPTGPAAMRQKPGQELGEPEPKRPKLGTKVKQVKELEHHQFADIYAQVVKEFPASYGSCDLYVTDYTENKEMFLYTAPEDEDEREREGDTFGYTGAPKKSWPGPYGQLILKVELKDPHAEYANKQISEGDFVLLKNVRMKTRSHLEGNIWPDDRNPSEVKISKLKDMQMSEILGILERKEKYWAARPEKISNTEEQPQTKKLSKKQKKRQREVIQAEKAMAGDETGKSNINKSVPGMQMGASNGLAKVDLNPHVRCSHEEVPISSIKFIADPKNERHMTTTPNGISYALPFNNAKYRTRVRVVDYEPKPLEEFAVPELSNDDKSDGSQGMDWESSSKYEWSFDLLLEDASNPKAAINDEDRVWVHVLHAEAQYLFGNNMDDPKDLTDDPRLLSKLREKLWVLWGDLEGKANGAQVSNRPFECCLAEYGIELDGDEIERASAPFGYRRMYSMFGVTIL